MSTGQLSWQMFTAWPADPHVKLFSSSLPCVLEIVLWHVTIGNAGFWEGGKMVRRFKTKQLQMFAVPCWMSVQHSRDCMLSWGCSVINSRTLVFLALALTLPYFCPGYEHLSEILPTVLAVKRGKGASDSVDTARLSEACPLYSSWLWVKDILTIIT